MNTLSKKVVQIAPQHNVKYIKFYKKLEVRYKTPANVQSKTKWTMKTNKGSADIDSKLGTYQKVDPYSDFTHRSRYNILEELDWNPIWST